MKIDSPALGLLSSPEFGPAIASRQNASPAGSALGEWRPSERSLTHWLALHLQEHYSDWDIDCEYNRLGDLPKTVQIEYPESTDTGNEEAATVFPDIIVHVDKEDEREQPGLVPIVAEQCFDAAHGETAKLARRSPRGRHADAEEAIAFAVLAWARLEETLKKGGVVRIARLAQATPGGGECGWL